MTMVAKLIAARRGIRYQGLEHLPPAGPALLAARHYHNFWDGLALLAASPRHVHVVVALDWVRSIRQRRLMLALTALADWPVLLRAERLRAGGDAATPFRPDEVPRYRLTSFRRCVDLLSDGRIVAFFPEGYPNVDPHYTAKHGPDEFLPFRAGFARAALAAARRRHVPIPVIPVGFAYGEVPPRGLVVRFGAPIGVDSATDPERLVADVEAAVRELCDGNPRLATSG